MLCLSVTGGTRNQESTDSNPLLDHQAQMVCQWFILQKDLLEALMAFYSSSLGLPSEE